MGVFRETVNSEDSRGPLSLSRLPAFRPSAWGAPEGGGVKYHPLTSVGKWLQASKP